MTRVLLATALSLSVVGSALAQVPEGATGGRSGGPNQSHAVIPSGTTGGRSGGPNQSQYVKKPHMKKKMH